MFKKLYHFQIMERDGSWLGLIIARITYLLQDIIELLGFERNVFPYQLVTLRVCTHTKK